MRLYIAAIAGNLGMISVGLFFGWASPSLPLLAQEDSPVKLTSNEASWVASLFNIGASGGSIISSFMVNKYGRKITMLFSALPSIIGWLLIAFAVTPWQLYISRIICGIAAGTSYATTPAYLGEISPPDVRGVLGSMLTVAAKIGMLLEYCIGPFVSVRNLAFISLSMPILFVMIFVWLPETPYQLMRRGQRKEAEDSLLILRGKKDIGEEMKIIEESVKADLENGTGLKDILCVSGNRRALITCLGLLLIQQMSGSQAVAAYAQKIYDAADSGLEGKYLTMMLGSIQIITTILSGAITDRAGRRPLLMISSVGCAFSTGLVALYFHLEYLDLKTIDVSGHGWLAACGMTMYIILYSVGLSALPFAMIGELFPTNVKALASTLCIFFLNFLSFVVIKTYQILNDYAGTHTAFWLYTGCSLVGTGFIYLYVSETNGKTLQDIQEELHSTKDNVSKNKA